MMSVESSHRGGCDRFLSLLSLLSLPGIYYYRYFFRVLSRTGRVLESRLEFSEGPLPDISENMHLVVRYWEP